MCHLKTIIFVWGWSYFVKGKNDVTMFVLTWRMDAKTFVGKYIQTSWYFTSKIKKIYNVCYFHIFYTNMLSYKRQIQVVTLTAAWWCVKVNIGDTSVPSWLLQILRTLSFPPLAKCLPSGDQLRPHTSWECPLNTPTQWLATLTSWWWIAPDLDPL